MSSRKIWTELEGEPKEKIGFLRRRVPLSSGLDVFLALAAPDNRQVLLMEISSDFLGSYQSQISCLGFNIRVTAISSEGKDNHLVILEIADSKFIDVFSVLADDITTAMSSTKDIKCSIEIFFDKIYRWQKFFRQIGSQGMTPIKQQGLYGELWVLKNILLESLPIDIALTAWQGPDGANQDFSLSSCAIEVKTTISNPHEKAKISNVLQLDDTGLPKLLLVHLALDQWKQMGESLTQIILETRKLLVQKAPLVLEVFDTLLVKAGYLEVHASNYDKIGYVLRHARFYHVHDDFPRLREKNLPDGIGDLTYSVMFSACSRFEISEIEMRTLLTERVS